MSDSTENKEESFSLPILAHKQRILDAMRFNRVIVISGETGSGKTTQLPKFCMELEKKRLICCTQPRRVATISVAERVEEELGNQKLVGWQHRFQRQTDKNNRIKFVTDGILLAEIKNDPMLRQYGIIMIDEAHERTLNIDFLLGYLKQLLLKRKDLRVIISSATIETQRFSDFFNNAPVLHISGRTYPITYKYLPPEDADDDAELPRIVSNAVVNAIQSGAAGDILVFLPGERDIKEACEILRGRFLSDCEIIPLMASLPPQEQRRAFTLVPGKRRVILATNVAETSVTIPNIKIVIDSGVARISRFSYRSHIKKLHIEPISQASANQRAGRCGRIAPGLCIRLYSEEDYKKRPEFTDPEIRRTSLAGTILTMLSRRLGDISTFPFIEPPANVAVREGYKELLWLKAIVPTENTPASANAPTSYQLTPLGRAIAQLTIEPRLARILFESKHFGVYSEALTIVAYLSGETVYVRPAEELDKANQAHAQFKSPHSDFDSILRLWEFFHPATGEISGTQKRKLCQKNYISFKRILEWEEIRLQLHKSFVEHEKRGEKRGEREGKRQQASHPATIPPIEPPEVRSIPHIHQAMLCGFLPNIGKYDDEKREYTGIDGKSFVIFPASSLSKRTPKWLLASELVDTSRTFARNVSPILIEWIEKAAEHVSKVHYTGQFWDAATGTARAIKTTTLGALTIATNSHADISKLYPVISRELFISEGIAQCKLPENIPPCLRQTFSNMRRALEQAAKLRKVDAADIATDCAAFYEARLPEECVNLAAFKRWLNTLPHKEKSALIFNPTLSAEVGQADKQQFPSELRFAEQRMRLSYKNAPGEEEDGITCTLLPEQIPFVRYLRSDWLVPGYLNDLVYFYITAIPQTVLHPALQLVEGSNYRNRVDTLVRDVFERLSANKYNASITAAISHAIYAATDCHIPEAIIAKATPTEHLQLRWRVVSANKKVLYETRKLSDLYEFYDELSKLVKLPKLELKLAAEQFSNTIASREVVLGNCGARELAIFVSGGVESHAIGGSAHEAQQLLISRIIEGMLKQNPGLVKAIGGGATVPRGGKKQAQTFNSLQSLSALTQEVAPAPDELSTAAAALMPTPEDLARGVLRNFILAHGLIKAKGLSASEQQHLALLAGKLRELAHGIALLWDSCMDMLDNVDEDTALDVTEQLNWLVFPGYMRSTPMSNIAQLMRYLEGVEARLTNAQLKPDVEERKLRDFGVAWQRYIELYANGARPSYSDAALQAYRWGVEEARLALWVPRLAQAGYSLKRLNELWHNVLSART